MPRMQLSDRMLVLDGEPRLIVSGEIHYFRVPRAEWANRITSLKEAGATMVATYIPWMWHELPDGRLDVTGETRPERDVGAFVDLCAEMGMTVLARPGPFVMAELLGEGIPLRLAQDHPEIVAVGWDGAPATSRALDYLAPAFLAEVRRWYEAILPVLAARTLDVGGPIAMVQLDNEIGMLQWVTNGPDLTASTLDGLRDWVTATHDDVSTRYPVDRDDPDAWATAVRSPDEAWAAALRVDLGHYMRARFATYVSTLRGWCDEYGLGTVPYLVNVHGTERGSAEPFGIGVSQLWQSFSGVPGMVSGSDHYLGPMTPSSAVDVTLINLLLSAVHDRDQPLTSVEFEAGTGDYGGGGEMLYPPETTDLKTRLFVAQGNKLLNYYLFAGGVNPRLDEPIGDGADRIAFTGELHGTAAPVRPDGSHGLSYDATVRAIAAVRVHERWLARMQPETDALQLGIVLDSYLTEYVHPASTVMTEIAADLRMNRGLAGRRALLAGVMGHGYRPGSVHLETTDPTPGGCLMVATSRFVDAEVQRRLVRHLEAGGTLLTVGRLPQADTEGRACTVLADALGLSAFGIERSGPRTYLTLVAQGWATPWPETRTEWVEPLAHLAGEVILTDLAGRPVGVAVRVGAGRAIHLGSEVPGDPELFDRLLGWLGVRKGLRVGCALPGVVATTTIDGDDRLLHLVNPSGFPALLQITFRGERLPDVVVPGGTGAMLPLGLPVPQGRIAWSDAELAEVADDHLAFGRGLGAHGSRVVLSGRRPLEQSGLLVSDHAGSWVVTPQQPGPFVVRF